MLLSLTPFVLSLSKSSLLLSCFSRRRKGKASTGSARTVGLAIVGAFLSVAPVQAETVTSTQISDVSVTIYRDPKRGEGAMDAKWPGGYAFINESRTITIPAGESTIRFEGVAQGLLPETAIITGLPGGVKEKNRDARLLSPAGLVDAYLKRSVVVTRTNPATGKVTREKAVIQAGPNGGVILQTASGVEALRCSGLPEKMLYPQVPADLSARPTLSVKTISDREVTATVQLSYIAQGFDWSANYVANAAPDGKTLALFSWLTIANGGSESFKNARLQVIAGKPEKGAAADLPETDASALTLSCWPMDITSTHPETVWERMDMPSGFDLSIYDQLGRNEDGYDRERDGIRVTAKMRNEMLMDSPVSISVMSSGMMSAPPPMPAMAEMAQQENLGDLKLYRVPMRVLVAAQSQKQVAMLSQPAAKFDRVYVARVYAGTVSPRPLELLLRATNTTDSGLGLPLPAGSLALFETVGERHLFAGENAVGDKAVGEEVEIAIGASPDVTWTLTRVSQVEHSQGWRAEINNARNVPVHAEIIVPDDIVRKPAGTVRRQGGWALPVTVPANDSAVVSYTLKSEGGL